MLIIKHKEERRVKLLQKISTSKIYLIPFSLPNMHGDIKLNVYK